MLLRLFVHAVRHVRLRNERDRFDPCERRPLTVVVKGRLASRIQCIDMHSIDARAAGETEQRLYNGLRSNKVTNSPETPA